MRELTYYPSMEPMNETWLKYSLLYTDRISSIVPNSRQGYVSNDYKRILNETDLLEMHNPKDNESVSASIRAIDEIEKFLNSDTRGHLFNSYDLRRKWSNQGNWNAQIYREKYTSIFWRYCIEQNIGCENDKGLLLPKEVAFIFMTHLATEVAHSRNSDLITDNLTFDQYTNHSRVINPYTNKREKYLKGVLQLSLPSNIENLSIAKLINFRNDNREFLKFFLEQIDLIQSEISKGVPERNFVEDFQSIQYDLNGLLSEFGFPLVAVPFSSYILLNNVEALQSEYAAEILAVLGLISSGVYTLKNSLKASESRRKCRKYLIGLNELY